MQKPVSKNGSMLLMSELELFNKLVPSDSPFRIIDRVIDFRVLADSLRDLYSGLGRTGYDIEQGLRSLVVQFWEDYSDREMENAIMSNMSVRWFCGFEIQKETPDHTYFTRLRDRIGKKRLATVLDQINQTLKENGLIGDVFSFIDASALITKTALWKERDEAIANGHEKLNNAVVSNYATDKDAKWGAKSKNKIWFGHKEHSVVDMRHGLITKTLSTPANILDHQAIPLICPKNVIIFADKGYDCIEVNNLFKKNGCQSAVIQKNDKKSKNKDRDRFFSKIRSPFESTFSHRSKRCRYRSTDKVTFQCIANAIAYNLKKASKLLSITLTTPPI